MRIIEGKLVVRDERFCIVAARFNESIVENLIKGAVDALKQHGADESGIHLVNVPGAMELPLAVKGIAKSRQYDGVVALGAVIRGGTPHFEYVSGQCASGLSRIGLEYDFPIGFGVLTCDTVEQAIERSGSNAANKGAEAALAAIEMVSLLRQLET